MLMQPPWIRKVACTLTDGADELVGFKCKMESYTKLLELQLVLKSKSYVLVLLLKNKAISK